jgi:hypothetical protein
MVTALTGLLGLTGAAQASSLGTLSVTKDKQFDGAGEFINSGGGLSSKNFQIDSDTNGNEIGIRARNGNQSTPPSSTISGNVYTVQPGTPFQFDFQFSPDANAATPSSRDHATDSSSSNEYWLQLQIDSDPTSGTNFTSIAGPVFDDNLTTSASAPDNSWDDGDSLYYTNEVKDNTSRSDTGGSSDPRTIDNYFGSGDWATDDQSIPYIVGNSWQPQWFITFDENLPGEYTLVFSAYDNETYTGAPLVTSTAVAKVVPEPASLALMGVGGLLLLSRRRATKH